MTINMVSECQKKKKNTVHGHDYRHAEKDEILQAPFGKIFKNL